MLPGAGERLPFSKQRVHPASKERCLCQPLDSAGTSCTHASEEPTVKAQPSSNWTAAVGDQSLWSSSWKPSKAEHACWVIFPRWGSETGWGPEKAVSPTPRTSETSFVPHYCASSSFFFCLNPLLLFAIQGSVILAQPLGRPRQPVVFLKI